MSFSRPSPLALGILAGLFLAGCDGGSPADHGGLHSTTPPEAFVSTPVPLGTYTNLLDYPLYAHQRSFAFPQGGPLLPGWESESPPFGNYANYSELPAALTCGATTVETRLLCLAAQMIEPANKTESTLNAASVSITAGATYWNGALIANPGASSVQVTATVNPYNVRKISIDADHNGTQDALRGGAEPGVTVWRSGPTPGGSQLIGNLAQRFDADNDCDLDETLTPMTQSRSFGTSGLAQGELLKFASYYAIGELQFCGDYNQGSHSVLWMYSSLANFFHSTGSTSITVAEPSSTTLSFSLVGSGGGHARDGIKGVWLRNAAGGSYTQVFNGTGGGTVTINKPSGIACGLTYVVVETQSGKIGTGTMTVTPYCAMSS